ncbi:MAG: hypothetical protein ACTSW1_13500 [Candidatus Hodarchaeales archaeon]
MLPKSKIENIVTRVITRDEKLGRKSGGSGHSSYVSFVLNTLGKPKKIQQHGQELLKISYTYTIIIETEFTHYPDNPPQEYKYQKSILIDYNGRLIKSYPKREV